MDMHGSRKSIYPKKYLARNYETVHRRLRHDELMKPDWRGSFVAAISLQANKESQIGQRPQEFFTVDRY